MGSAHYGLVETECRHRNDNFIAGVNKSRERSGERFCGATGDDDILGCVGKPLLPHIRRERFAKNKLAVIRRVMRLSLG